MKKQFLFLILCIGLLLSGCQKTPEASPAAQPVEPPWETESPFFSDFRYSFKRMLE